MKDVGFTIKLKQNYFSATHYSEGGRYHLLYELVDNKVFCDFHFDNTIHIICFGVDYRKKPQTFFNIILRERLDKENITYETKNVDWFARKNKAIVTGFRI